MTWQTKRQMYESYFMYGFSYTQIAKITNSRPNAISATINNLSKSRTYARPLTQDEIHAAVEIAGLPYYQLNPQSRLSLQAEIIGEAIKGLKERIIILSRLGISYEQETGQLKKLYSIMEFMRNDN